ncbi:MAG TPA: DUF4352 domain-containing protein [Chitinophagaceae bacterium]|jgi:hypothetical protein|nr:DUF4352 domain-containing protein [Chitinophagaceae bacterium]
MKTSISLLTISTTLLVLVSCNSDTKGSKSGKTEPGKEEKTAEKPKENSDAKINDVVTLGEYNVTVLTLKDNAPAPDEFSTPEAGKKFVAIEVLYENKNSEPFTYNTFDWKLVDGNAYSYESDFTQIEPSLGSGPLNGGKKARGWVTFQTPKDASQFKVQFAPPSLLDESVDITLQ